MITKKLRLAILSSTLLVSAESSAGTIKLFSDRQFFTLGTGISITDDYENSNYHTVMSDSEMSAVLGETTYFTYGGNIADYNNIIPGFGVDGGHSYCSLCYGSFRLSFDNTSLISAGGIYGLGMDITVNYGAIPFYKYTANITFGDGYISSFELPYVVPNYPAYPIYQFWGITSDLGIHSIDLISYSSSGVDRTFLHIDNLTIAASPVPVPPLFVLILTGISMHVLVARRRKTQEKMWSASSPHKAMQNTAKILSLRI